MITSDCVAVREVLELKRNVVVVGPVVPAVDVVEPKRELKAVRVEELNWVRNVRPKFEEKPRYILGFLWGFFGVSLGSLLVSKSDKMY